MLSDEENKMLEIFKKEVEKEQNEYEQVNEYTKFYYNNHKFILNLIEKQSKEIEELKEENEKYIVQLTDEQYRKLVDIIRDKTSKEWEDKIKAKIEEWDKDIKWNNADDHYYAIKMMQSLLEKE